MASLVVVRWAAVRTVESVLPPYYIIKVSTSSASVVDTTIATGITKVATTREPSSIAESHLAMGVAKVAVASSAVYPVELVSTSGPMVIVAGTESVSVAETVPAPYAVLIERGSPTDRGLGQPGNLSTLVVDVGAYTDDEVDAAFIYVFVATSSRQSQFSTVKVHDFSLDDKSDMGIRSIITDAATMGFVMDLSIKPAFSDQWDEASTIDVFVSSGEIESVSGEDVLGGRNHIVLGGEVIGFRTATALTNTDEYRLSGLLRGMYGTPLTDNNGAKGVWALISGPGRNAVRIQSGELDEEQVFSFVPIPFSVSAREEDAVFTPTGRTLRPFPVSSLTGTKASNNDWTLSWSRSSRMPNSKLFAARPVVDTDPVKFHLDILTSATDQTVKRTISVDGSETATYTAAQQTTDFGSSQTTIYVNVYRVNDWGSGQGNTATLIA